MPLPGGGKIHRPKQLKNVTSQRVQNIQTEAWSQWSLRTTLFDQFVHNALLDSSDECCENVWIFWGEDTVESC